jgi:YidC/Oxa1 family membrane protein insertase
MDNIRLILILALSFVLLMIWQAWEQDYGSLNQVAGQQAAAPTEAVEAGVPQAPMVANTPVATNAELPVAEKAPEAEAISVKTDLLDIEISTLGGGIQSALLRDYPVSLEEKENKFQLLKKDAPNLFIAQSGLIGAEKELAPTHQATYQAKAKTYQLTEGEDKLVAELVWEHPAGIKVIKRYTFHRGSYVIDLEHEVVNASGRPWNGREYRQLQRARPPEGEGSALVYTYTGAAIYSPEEKYEKIAFDDMDKAKLERQVTGGWISMLQHYFLGAWIPPAEEQNTFYSNVLAGGRYVIGMFSPAISIADGASHSFSSQLFIGPKIQKQMAEAATGLELTVDYGWLTVLAQPIYWLMEKLHSLLGNWGWSIILLTILIKAAFYKLSEASYKSMANMRKLGPRLQAMKERYGDDKARLNQAMMEMYKKEKINPLGGCLPVMVQIPVFIALYWVLLEAVELRQAPFIFWITDLSMKDPYFVLPLIMGASMFIQQKLNPAPVDPMQAKVMMSLPFVFTVFFAFFPAGLVLYWVVNNLISITQQGYITRKIEQAAK